jgi:hypothetical protein
MVAVLRDLDEGFLNCDGNRPHCNRCAIRGHLRHDCELIVCVIYVYCFMDSLLTSFSRLVLLFKLL